VLFHEFAEDGVLALELGFEPFDLVVLGVLGGFALAAVGEGQMSVLEELLQPVVDLVGMKIEFVAQLRDRDLIEEVPFDDGDLLVILEVTACLVHDDTSVQVMLTRTERSSRFD